MAGPERPVAVIVDGYTTGNHLPPAFARHGADVVHVQSSRELMTSMMLPDFAAYRANVVCDTPQEAAARLAEFSPVAVVCGQEPGVEWTDRLAELLGLSGNSTDLSLARRNKYEMIEVLRRAGLRCAEQFLGTDVDEIVAWAAGRGTVVVKPLTSAATDGVAICTTEAEVRKAAEYVLTSSTIFGDRNTEVLVQDYLAGEEYVVDMVSHAGQRYTCEIGRYSKRLIGTHNIYDRDDVVDPADPRVAELVRYVGSVLDALGIRFGPTHAEVIYTADGPTLVEVGARLSGGVVPAFQDLCLGANQADLTALAAIRPQEFLDRYAGRVYQRRKHALWCVTGTELDGVVSSVDAQVVAEIEALPTVRHLRVKIGPGQRIKPTVDLYTSTLSVHLAANDAESIERDYARLQDLKDRVYRLA